MTDRHQKKPYPLRMPDELRERLEEEAARLGRSLHAEIVARLQDSFSARREARREDILEVVRLVLEELQAAKRRK